MKKITRLLFIFFLSLTLFFSLSDIGQAGGRGGYRGYRSSGYRGSRSYKKSGFGTYKTKSYKSKSPSLKTYKPKSSSFKISAPKVNKKYNTTNFSNKPKRSTAKKQKFLKSRGYDKAPSGQEVDHVIPLSKGGADEPYNMQLLPKEMHKQKTKMEQSGNKGYLLKR